MTDKITLDLETGLPELPKGYYWEVVGSNYHSQMYYIQLVKKNRFFPKVVKDTLIDTTPDGTQYRDGAPLTKENILHNAKYVMKWWDEELKALLAEQKYLGKYPPNRLGE